MKTMSIDYVRELIENTLAEEHEKNPNFFGGKNQVNLFSFYEQLQKDSITGTVMLGGRNYQIAGVYEKLHKGKRNLDNLYVGSAFLVDKNDIYHYFRFNSQADVQECMKKLETICRKYVPETLPLSISCLSDDGKTIERTVTTVCYAFLILGIW